MAEQNIEADAESLLLAAVMAPDGQDLEAPDKNKLDTGHDLDRDDDETVDKESRVEGETEQKSETKAKPGEAATDDDEIELPADEEGKEPTRLKLKDVVADYREYQQFKGQRDQVLDRVESEAVQRVTQTYRQVEQWSQHAAAAVQAALQLLQPPQAPNTDMLNPASASYNPDQYHVAFANFQRSQAQHGQALQLGQHLMAQAQQAQAAATEARETRELEKLTRAWPEFGQDATLNQFVSDMGKAYGFTPGELDAVLTDHRQALVARDALAYRAMKAKSGDVKAKVEAKAPKLVRSKQEAKGSSAQARDAKGQFAADALASLKKTNSDDAAAAYFAGLVKAGRI